MSSGLPKHFDSFQSTLPVRGATGRKSGILSDIRFQSTLPVRGATCHLAPRFTIPWISIHAPREGSDLETAYPQFYAKKFQSTLPVRGATAVSRPPHGGRDISIHAPREGSDDQAPALAPPRADFNPRSP